ncbi:MAG: MATE family efflux transporter [Lachnospiraceae bacterium]|nr:MATE family efflux transporter [Lachnospiraceae bacterium]
MLYTNKDLRKLILPLVMEQFLTLLVGMADTIMISGVGEAAVSGVSLVDTINVLVINVFVAFGTGGAVAAGHFLGQKDSQKACKAAWQTTLFSVLMAVLVTILFVALHDGLLRLVFGNVEVAVMQNAKDYLVVTAFSIAPLALYNACAGMLRAMNDSKTTMWISILMNIINITGNAILIYGVGMGAAGAALSTTISRVVGAVIIFCLMFRKDKAIHFVGQITWRFELQYIKKILYIGVPNSLENSMFQLGKILTISMVSSYGTYAIAANAVCNTLAAFNVLPGLAINNALLAVAAVCVGAGEFEQARYYTKKLMKIATCFLAGMTLLIVLGGDQIIGFYNLSPQASELAVQVFTYHGIMAVFFWLPSFSLPNTLRAAGDVVWSMAIGIFSMWVFRLMFSWLLGSHFGMGLMGVWVAMTVDWVFRACCYLLRFKGHKWEKA